MKPTSAWQISIGYSFYEAEILAALARGSLLGRLATPLLSLDGQRRRSGDRVGPAGFGEDDRERRPRFGLDAELRALPAEAFARKFELQSEADAVRRELADLMSDDLEEARGRWAERSGRKGSHADPDPAEQVARIVSPIEGGGIA